MWMSFDEARRRKPQQGADELISVSLSHEKVISNTAACDDIMLSCLLRQKTTFLPDRKNRQVPLRMYQPV